MTRVLIVDDDARVRPLLANICVREDYTPEFASNGAEAIAVLSEHPVEVMLLDLMMPKMNGLEVIEALRGDDSRPEVVVVTAQGEKQVPALDPDMVYAVVHKPFDVNDLLGVLRGAVRKRRRNGT